MTTDHDSVRLRILLHLQQERGVGHYVRTSEIAKALAGRHDVMLTDGGRPIPRDGMEGVAMLPLPRVARQGIKFVPMHGHEGLDAVMQARQDTLRQAIGAFRPDVVIVENYPFSKWAMGHEVIGVVGHSRAANAAVKIICSIRDIQPRTRAEDGSDESYAREVLNRLHPHFDGIFVHGDPAFSRLEEEFPFLRTIGLRIDYSGIVSEKPSAMPSGQVKAATRGAPFILASVGGGADRFQLLRHVFHAWTALTQSGGLAGWKLVLSPGLDGADDDLTERVRGHGEDVVLRPFASDFLAWLKAAELSVSLAGYNTCANILETRRRAVLVPDPNVSDQVRRAGLLADRQLAAVVPFAELDSATLAAAMLKCLAGPQPHHNIALDGAVRTRLLIEEIAAKALAARQWYDGQRQ